MEVRARARWELGTMMLRSASIANSHARRLSLSYPSLRDDCSSQLTPASLTLSLASWIPKHPAHQREWDPRPASSDTMCMSLMSGGG